MDLPVEAIEEDKPGPKWQQLFSRHWPAYERWFTTPARLDAPYYLTCLRSLRQHMPELVPTYETLVELAGGGDTAARFLSMVNPPPYLTACSQAVIIGVEPVLARNYDYSPKLIEGAILKTDWCKPVIAMSDCLWGVLDGINGDGLAVSLSFGGRRAVGQGFGVPLVLRYLLEVCSTTQQAADALLRVPVHMSYNVTVADAAGDFATAYLAPDRAPKVRADAVSTNHQDEPEWHEHAKATSTLEREQFLLGKLAQGNLDAATLIDAFLRPPLYSTALERGFGTLYTAVYGTRSRSAEYRWPGMRLRQSFEEFHEAQVTVRFEHVRALSHAVRRPAP
jgi:predicted choloylglycine hydrolase